MDHRSYDKYIIKIAEYGSLTKAAASLGISQPALSSGLTNLEAALGFKIFNRKSTPITLTPEGELYYDYITRLHVLEEDFRQRIDGCRDKVNLKAVIGGPVAYVESMVTSTVIELSKVHTDYRFDIKCSPLAELIELLSKGEINCFICTSDTIPDNFEKKLVKREKVYLCIPRDNPLNESISDYSIESGNYCEYFDYSVLDGEEFIFLEENQPLYSQMNKFFEDNCITPKNRITVNQVSTALRLSAKGGGISFVSEGALENTDLSRICVYPLPDTISGRSIYVAYDRELSMPVACKDFIHYLIDHKNETIGV